MFPYRANKGFVGSSPGDLSPDSADPVDGVLSSVTCRLWSSSTAALL